MSTDILHRSFEDVDDQIGDPGFLANAVLSDADDIDYQYRDLDDLCLAYPDDQHIDDAASEPLSSFYQQARNLVLDGWRLTPAFGVNRPDVHVVVSAPNVEVAQ